MSRRGAGSLLPKESRFEHVPVNELGRPVIATARALLRQGLTPGEVCSLFTHAAAVLSQQEGGLSREEWLDLCEELYDRGAVDGEARLTAPGGVA